MGLVINMPNFKSKSPTALSPPSTGASGFHVVSSITGAAFGLICMNYVYRCVSQTGGSM